MDLNWLRAAVVDWLWKMEDHNIAWWTLIFTAIGVIAGLVVLAFTYCAVQDTRIQIRANARTTKAQFGLLLRQAFTSHNEAHGNLRPGGIWHSSNALPDAPGDFVKIETLHGFIRILR
jgi:hypothetical protein